MDTTSERTCVSCGRAAHDYGLDGCVNTLLGEVQRLRDGIEAAVREVDGWTPYNSRDTGETYLAGTVEDLADELRALLDAR